MKKLIIILLPFLFLIMGMMACEEKEKEDVLVKTGSIVDVGKYMWIWAECTGFEVYFDDNNEYYKPDNLPDEFKVDNLQVKITYRLSGQKHVCGTGDKNNQSKREVSIIDIVKIEKI
jgi:hypothetical protein